MLKSKIMKRKKALSLLLATIMVCAFGFANTAPVSAATFSKTVRSSNSMVVTLKQGNSGNSNTVLFNVSDLPANATVTKIVVHTGTLKYAGAVLTNELVLSSSNKRTPASVSWRGYGDTDLTFDTQFYNTPGNGIYSIYFNATCIGGFISHGMVTDIGVKEYKYPSITIYYEQ